MSQSQQSAAQLREELRALRARVAELEQAERERDRAEDLARQSEEKWRSVVDTAPIFTLIIDPDGTIRYINRTVPPLQLEDVIGTSVYHFIPAEYHETMRTCFAEVLHTGEFGSYESPGPGPYDSTLWYSTRVGPLRSVGEIVALTLIAIDITDRKNAEKALRENEERFRAIADNLPGAVFSYDFHPDFRRTPVYVGPGMSQLIGEAAAARISAGAVDHFFELIHPEDLAAMRRSGQFEAEFAEPVDHEYRLRGESGAYKWVRAIARPTRLGNGDLRWHGVLIDISSKKQAEKELQESEARYRGLFDRVPVGLYRSTPDGQILDANTALVQMLGYPNRESLLAANARTIYAQSSDRDRLLEDIDRHGVAVGLEFRLRRYDGASIWIKENVRTIRDADGAVLFYEGSLEDVTERKHTEEALRESETRLRVAVESIPFDFFILDEHERYVMQNSTCARHWGNVVGKRPDDVVTDPAILSIWKENNRRALAGEVVKEEVSFKLADGERTFYNIITPVVEDDQIRGLLGVNIDITERKQAEMALRTSEQQYRAIVHDQTELICRFTPDMKLTFVNDAYCRFFDQDRAQLLGHSFLPLILEEDRKRVRQTIAALGPDDPIAIHEHQVIGADGQKRWQRWTNRTILDADDRVIELQAVGLDITERKQAEEALRRTTDTLNNILNSATEYAIAATDLDLRVIHYNPAAERIFELPADQVIGRCVVEIHRRAGVDPKRVERAAETVRRDGKWETLLRLPHSDGGERLIHPIVTPMRDATGTCIGYVLLAHDITEQKRAQDALLDTKQRLDHLLRSSPAVVYGCGPGPDHPTTFISENVFGLLGLHAQQFYDDPYFWQKQIHPDDVDRVLAELATIQHGAPVSYEYRFRHADGHYVWLHDKLIPSYDSDGKVSGLVGSWFDITARKQVEEERERLTSQLRQSQKLQAVGQLAAGVAHDFNSLLMVMLGNIELMLAKRRNPQSGPTTSIDQDALEQMSEAVERGRNLVQKLLTFGRAQKAKPQKLDLNQILTDMGTMLRGLLDRRVKLELKPAADLKPIRADVSQIEQAIMNLVINARDAMPDGGTLEIETANVMLDEAYVAAHAEAQPGPHILFAVRDTGHGMDPATLERLFEPFFSTKPVDKGAGLGLSIVHGIVKQAGGHIEVQSKSGEGTVFKLYFPAID